MKSRTLIALPCVLVLVLASCSKKSVQAATSLDVVPAGYQLVARVEGKSLIAFYRSLITNLGEMLPEDAREDIPSWDKIVKQVKDAVGVDLNRIGEVVMAVDLKKPRKPDVVMVVSGLAIGEIKGEKVGSVYKIEDAFYTALADSRVAFASGEETLKRLQDTVAGKAKRLVDEKTLLPVLLAEDPDLGQVRMYIVSGKLPGLERVPFTLKGGGFFMDMKKGASIVLHSDEEGAGRLKGLVDMGLKQARLKSGQMLANMPPGKEAEKAKEMVGVFLNGLKVERDGAKVKAAYRGGQSPAMIVGAMAAVAIPAFVSYIRKSKAIEVQMQLAACHQAVQRYFMEDHPLPDGSLSSHALPASMKEPVCPGTKTVATLDDKSAQFDPRLFKPGGKGEILEQIGMGFDQASYGCYQLIVDTPGQAPKSGQGFACHAWTNLDDDDKPAHWVSRCTYQGEGSEKAFNCSKPERETSSDDW